MKRHLSAKKLGALSIAAGAATFGAAGSAEAALQVFDHRTAPIYAITEYFLFDQTLAVLNVKTGDFQYVVEQGGNPGEIDGVNTPDRYNQDGFVDNNLIPETDLTNDTVWLSHRDANIDIGYGGGAKPCDVVTVETATGGAAGIWLSPFFGESFTEVDGILSQTVPGTEGGDYTFSGWSRWETNYTAALTFMELSFLDGNDAVIGTPVMLDLSTEQSNDNQWRQHTLSSTAPTGTESVLVSAGMLDGVDAGANPQSAFFDDFSLELAAGLPGDAGA